MIFGKYEIFVRVVRSPFLSARPRAPLRPYCFYLRPIKLHPWWILHVGVLGNGVCVEWRLA
jgi:hypothetical protein